MVDITRPTAKSVEVGLGDILGQDLQVVLISNALDQVEALSKAAVENAEVIVYDAELDDLSTIIAMLEDLVDSTGQEIGQLAIVSHGAVGTLALANGEIWTVERLQADTSEWAELGGLLTDDAVIDLYGCYIGQGELGTVFVETFASVTDAEVRASDDSTGNVDGSDWDFEVTTGGSDAAALIDDSQLEPGTIRLDDYTVDAGDTYTGDLVGSGGDDRITINGTVTGRVYAGDGHDTITNNGSIEGDLVGYSGDDLIVNSGTVDGAIWAGGGSDTITNTGYADKIAGQGSDDTIFTSGEVGNGGIMAGGGNDIVSWNGGSIGGVIDGQNGYDVLNLYIPEDYPYSGTPSSGSVTYNGETIKWQGFEEVNLLGDPGGTETTANGDAVTANEDLNVSFDVLANDAVSDTGGTLTVVNVDTSSLLFPDNLEQITNGTFIYYLYSHDGYLDFDYLAVGQSATETFKYTIEDEEGETSTATVTITINGVNDDPQLLLQDDSGSVTEDSDDPNLSCTGSYNIHDEDTADTHTTTFSYNDDLVWSGGTLTTDQTNTLTVGFSVDDGDPLDRNDQTWNYTVANADVQFLDGAETVTFSYDLTLSDGNGGSETKTVTITIYGSNATASISGDDSGSLTEDGTPTQVSGTLTVTDPDPGEDVFQTPASADLQGTYGAFTFDETTGSWTYTLDNSDPDTNALTQDQVVTDALTVTSADGTATDTIEIAITGTNDSASISGDDSGSLTEDDSTTVASGNLIVDDPDSGEGVFAAVSSADLQGTYGAFTFEASTGSWTYTLDNSDPDTNALAQGQVETDTITVTSADGTATKTIEITITGTNDAPASADNDVTIDEKDSYTFQITDFVFTDVDTGSTLQWVKITDLPDVGTFTWNGSSVQLNDEIPVSDITSGGLVYVPELNGSGDPYADFGFQVSDGIDYSGSSYTMTIVVAAVNDAPVISSPASLSLSEDSSIAITGVLVSDVDVDLGTGEVQVTLGVSHGILTLSETSGLSFDAGSNGSSYMTVSGILADVNAALSTLTYTPSSNYYGTDSVQISVNDLGNYGAPGPLEDSATIALTVTDIIDYKPVYNDSFIEQSTSSTFSTSVGPEPQLGEVFSLLGSRGLLPVDLTSHEDGGQSSPALLHLRSLLFEALFGEEAGHRNSAWDAIHSLIHQGKSSANGDTWLGLEAFMARMKEWMVGKDTEDIRLVFNEDQIKLTEWVDSIMADNALTGTNIPDPVTGLNGYSEETGHGKTLIFNLQEMKVIDLLLSHDAGKIGTEYGQTNASCQASIAALYELDEVSLLDVLAS